MVKSVLALAAAAALVLGCTCDAPPERPSLRKSREAPHHIAAPPKHFVEKAERVENRTPYQEGVYAKSRPSLREQKEKEAVEKQKEEEDITEEADITEADEKQMEAHLDKAYLEKMQNAKVDKDKRAAARAKLDIDLHNLELQLDEDKGDLWTLCLALSRTDEDNSNVVLLTIRRSKLAKESAARLNHAIERVMVSGDDGGAMESLAEDAPSGAPWGDVVRSARSKALQYHQLLKEYDVLLDRHYDSRGKPIAHDDYDGPRDFATALEARREAAREAREQLADLEREIDRMQVLAKYSLQSLEGFNDFKGGMINYFNDPPPLHRSSS